MMQYVKVFIPLIALGINIAVQVCGVRYIKALGVLKSVILGFAAGFAALICLEFVLSNGLGWVLVVDAATDAVTYGALGYCYFHFINMGETARRIRILRELYEAGGVLTLEEIMKRYNASEMVHHRLNRLLANGQIKYENGRYFIADQTVLNIAKVMGIMKHMMLGRRSETDIK